MTHVGCFRLAAVLALVLACGQSDRSRSAGAETGSADSAGAAPPAERAVSNVMIGSQMGSGNRIIQPTIDFTAKDTVHLSVAVSGAGGADRLTAAWRSQTGEVVQQSSEPIGEAGENTAFHLAPAKGLKPGTYKVIVFLGGDSVATKVFRVSK